MWVAKVKIDGSNALIGQRAKKYNVTLTGYPLASHESENKLYRYFVAFIFGEPQNIKEFIQILLFVFWLAPLRLYHRTSTIVYRGIDCQGKPLKMHLGINILFKIANLPLDYCQYGKRRGVGSI